MSMGFMVAAASRKRDGRGRYMEGNDRRMDGGYDRPEGNHPRVDGGPDMRRRRDERGRYMAGDDEPRMTYDGNQGAYGRMEHGGASSHYWPEPHIPPYLEHQDMRGSYTAPAVGVTARMRDRNVVNIRDYQDKRKIGFGANRSEDDDVRRSQSRDPHERMHMGESNKGELLRGHAGVKHEKLTREKAEKWVRKMHGDDPSKRGEMWSYDDAKQLAEERGIPSEGQDMVDFYAALNMVYTDFSKVAKDHSVDTEDFFADLACAWLYDRDGLPPEEKLSAYYMYVIPHKED